MNMKEFLKHAKSFRWWRCPVFRVWIPAGISKEEEIKMLEEAKEYFKERLEEIEKRLEGLKS